jgi:hypothetical protein
VGVGLRTGVFGPGTFMVTGRSGVSSALAAPTRGSSAPGFVDVSLLFLIASAGGAGTSGVELLTRSSRTEMTTRTFGALVSVVPANSLLLYLVRAINL